MAYLTVEEMKTHLAEELVDLVTNDTDSIIEDAIAAGIEEALGYLNAYDTAAIFAATGTTRNKILLVFVKDITAWHFLQLASPNIDMSLREKRYILAIEWLEKVQKGKTTPTLPRPDSETPPPGKLMYGSTKLRKTSY